MLAFKRQFYCSAIILPLFVLVSDIPAWMKISAVSYTHLDVYKRQGYMIDIVARYIQTDIFAEIRSRYVEFPKISFD